MANDPPLDEIQWRSPALVYSLGGLNVNTIHLYFFESPFFDRTSNNAVLASQAMYNPSMANIFTSREAFDSRLRTMSGLEFMVTEEPPAAVAAGTAAPGAGPAVWVIRKQMRRKRIGGLDYDIDADEDEEGGDEITVLAEYFVVGENIYMAPTLADILISRIEHISASIAQAIPAADQARDWSPAQGHTYRLTAPSAGSIATATATGRGRSTDSAAATPAPSSSGPLAVATGPANTRAALDLQWLAEETFQTHMKFGTDYLDENPITGRPGEFHLSTTSRAARAAAQAAAQAAAAVAAVPVGGSGISALGTSGPLAIDTAAAAATSDKKEGGASAGGGKTPKTPTGTGRLKRRKSKVASLSPT